MSNLYDFRPQKASKFNIPDNEPIYRITGNGFFDGATLLTEYDNLGNPVLIAFDGEPNFNLLPMNELALKATEAWLEKLKCGSEEAKKDPQYAAQGGLRSGVMTQDINIRAFMTRISDSGRFDTKRIEPSIMSEKVNKATARVIEQAVIDTPEIKSVHAKRKQDQTAMVNERG